MVNPYDHCYAERRQLSDRSLAVSSGGSGVLLMKHEIEMIDMNKTPIVAIAVILISLGIGLASATERDGRGKSREPVEKTFSVGNETLRIRATIVTKDSVVEVVHMGEKTQQGSSKGMSNIVARVYIHSLIPETYDFALSRSGRILWFVVPVAKDGLPPGGRFHAIYPLLRDDATNQYDLIRKRRPVVEDRHGVVRNAIDLTGILRGVSRFVRAKDGSITAIQERTLTDLRIECSEGESAIVSGKLGSKYSFSGEIGLGNDCRFWARGFEINEIAQQKESPSVPQVPEVSAGSQ